MNFHYFIIHICFFCCVKINSKPLLFAYCNFSIFLMLFFHCKLHMVDDEIFRKKKQILYIWICHMYAPRIKYISGCNFFALSIHIFVTVFIQTVIKTKQTGVGLSLNSGIKMDQSVLFFFRFRFNSPSFSSSRLNSVHFVITLIVCL